VAALPTGDVGRPIGETLLGRFAGDALLYNAAALAASALSIALVPVLTRLFPPDLYGVADTALQVAATLGALLVLGMDSAVAREFFDSDDPQRRRTALATGFGFLVLIGTAGTAATILLAPPVSALFLGSSSHLPLLRLALLSLPFLVLEGYLRNVFRWRGERGRYFAATVAGSALRLLLSLGLALQWGIAGLIAGAALGTGASALFSFLLAARAVRGRPRPSAIPAMLSYAVPMALLGLAWPAAVLVDRAVLVQFRSEWDLGVYAAGFKLAAFYTLLTEGLRQSWGPLAFSRWSQPGFDRMYGRLFHAYVIAGVAVVSALSLMAPEAARLLLGPQFRGASVLVGPLMAGLLAADLFNMLGIGLYYRRWSGRFALMGWLAVAAGALGALVLVPWLGGLGAAIAGALARAAAAVGVCLFSQRALRVRYPWARLLPVLLLLPASAVAGMVLDLPLRLAGLVALAVILFGAAIALVRGTEETRTLEGNGVVFVLSTLEVGGAEVQTREVASALAAGGIPVTILTLYRLGPIADLPFHAGVRVVTAGKRHRFDLPGIFRAVAAILAARPAVVHGLLFEARIWAALAAALSGARLVVSEHGLWEYPRLHGRIFGWLARRASACVVSSEAAAEHIGRRYGVPAEVIRVVPNAVPRSCWDHRWQPAHREGRRPMVGVVGRLEHPTKGHIVLFEAVRLLGLRGVHVSLDVVGDGPDRAFLEERAISLGLSDRIRFLGAEVPPWSRFTGWDVLVVPSLYEGFANVVVEGLAIGVPIVATSCGGPSEILTDGSGVIIPPGDPDALADALSAVLADPVSAAERATRGQALARDRFSVERMAGGMRAVYARALGEAR
jgi:glycosyltransferase involved in cell wall biosynthesis/O-antigen/teichoic acid export membrane protein